MRASRHVLYFLSGWQTTIHKCGAPSCPLALETRFNARSIAYKPSTEYPERLAFLEHGRMASWLRSIRMYASSDTHSDLLMISGEARVEVGEEG